MSPDTPSEAKLPEIPTEGGPLPAAPAPTAEAIVEKEPTAAEDLASLRKVDCLKACVQRWKTGTHPNPELEKLLERRLPLLESRFLTPFPLRLLSAMAIILAGCVVAWGALWFICWQFGYTDYLQHLSVWMTILVVGLGGVVIGNPGRSYDEITLEKVIKDELQQLEKQGEQESQKSAAAESPAKQKPPTRTES